MTLRPQYAEPDLFAGSDYLPARDDKRLLTQLERILELMRDGQWRALYEIERATGYPAASISAQLRNLRKERFGSWDVQRKHLGCGLFAYRVDPASGTPVQLRMRT